MTERTSPLKNYVFGSRKFYKRLLYIVVPITVQNTLTNVVSLLDNVMVGRLGTLPMSAVAVDNQLLFVFYLLVFGGLAGAGIYGAQFYGKGDAEGVRDTFRIKLFISLFILALGLAVFGIFGMRLAETYVAEGTLPEARAVLMREASSYLRVMLLGLPPFLLTQCYAGTLRECGRSSLPMKASVAAMAINFVGNLLLIFGLLGFPALGVTGAAVATVISRFAELGIIIFCVYRDREQYPFFTGAFRGLRVRKGLLLTVLCSAFPLLVNEALWSSGEAVLLQLYSTRGIDAVAALNINNTVGNVFNTMFLSVGSGAGILVGQELGAGRLEKAVQTAWRTVFASVVACAAVGLLEAAIAPVVPRIYNTEPLIRALAVRLLLISALMQPLRGIENSAYFIMRSGGRVFITMLFDSCFSWALMVPLAWFLAYRTELPIVPFFLLSLIPEVVKCGAACICLKKRLWVRNLVT